MTVQEIYKNGPLAMLRNLGLDETLATTDLKNLQDVQRVADVAAKCT